ncbi:MAG TPA: serine protease [Casimicrobiaceae bacterium]|nr:serine protease [Casimicrobiaceae bacterium]
MIRIPLLAVLAAVALSPNGDAFASITAVPPAEYRPAQKAAKAPPALAAPAARALRIVLPEPTADEKRSVRQKNEAARDASGKPAAKGGRLAIGFPRDVPAGAGTLSLARLDWQAADGGSRVARIEVKSSGAAAVRLALAMGEVDPDLSVRFTGNAPGAVVHGPYPANVIADAVARLGRFVTPVLEGDTAVVELHAAPGARVDRTSLTLGPVSHLLVAGAALGTLTTKEASDIGSSGACNIDLACVTPSTALSQAANAVGKLLFNDRQGSTYACTGTLLNDSIRSFTPYLLTAAHCIEGAYEAATTDVYWFFQAVACGSRTVPPYVQQAGGAMLLARSDDWDWALLRLHDSPPAGTFFAAWRAEPVPALAVATGLHHPQGDLLKFSQGSTAGYEVYSDGSSFIRQQWSQGTTETGSSGSALFTFLQEGGYYEARGALFGGEASCANRSGLDYYSRLDNMLPLVRQYLTPDASNPSNQGVVVEYYSRSLDHYFITSDPNEINLLDTGTIAGWERTGVRFLAYNAPAPGASPVCRFYLTPAVGNSHFYSADPAECDRVKQKFGAAWVFESASVFYIPLPNATTGACPAGTRPLWRFFNARTLNHRYTPEVTLRQQMRTDPQWQAEGYGPDQVIMCSPATN